MRLDAHPLERVESVTSSAVLSSAPSIASGLAQETMRRGRVLIAGVRIRVGEWRRVRLREEVMAVALDERHHDGVADILGDGRCTYAPRARRRMRNARGRMGQFEDAVGYGAHLDEGNVIQGRDHRRKPVPILIDLVEYGIGLGDKGLVGEPHGRGSLNTIVVDTGRGLAVTLVQPGRQGSGRRHVMRAARKIPE